MIEQALILLQKELNDYITKGNGNKVVLLRNIAQIEQESGNLADSIYISLVNIEEESALKNIDSRFYNGFTNSIEYVHPPIHLNLYLLFTCVSETDSGASTHYQNSLGQLGSVVRFFQHRRNFSIHNAPNSNLSNFNDPTEDDYDSEINNFKLIMDLYTLTFEQINHLWGSLGGKQMPFAMYKARLIEIKEDKQERGGGIITEIQSNEKILAPSGI